MSDELWRLVLAYLREEPCASEPSGRDSARVDELFAELYVLGERPSVEDVRDALAELGTGESWANEVAKRWRKRVRQPTWKPRELTRSGSGWLRPFFIPERLVTEHVLRPIPDRLAEALAIAARDCMRRSATDPESAGTSDEAAMYALTAGAVRLWALSQDAADGVGWPSVLSCALVANDTLGRHWTNAGRSRDPYFAGRNALERD